MSEHILLVEDDPRLAEMLQEYLGQAGLRVTHAALGQAALELLRTAGAPFNAVILDLMLPDMDGLDVCRQLRAAHDTPVLMLTARGDAIDRIVGLELGADDYLPKPFEPRELLARLRAILRRRVDVDGGRAGAHGGGATTLRYGRLEIAPDAHAVTLAGAPCELTAYQYELLLALARNAGRVLSRETLMELVKGEQLEAFDRSIDVHMSRIRAAVEDDPKKPRRIITVRGAGYVFAKVQD
ncbi:response regulator transcription factor [Rugamonas sp.]|uniref:response regulator n=1 Tax=Rugamonas sp. TaxID=1926287 RepID=UPI0025E4A37E|nr:response regulator transcription factor [Rugamonas sp.]